MNKIYKIYFLIHWYDTRVNKKSQVCIIESNKKCILYDWTKSFYISLNILNTQANENFLSIVQNESASQPCLPEYCDWTVCIF